MMKLTRILVILAVAVGLMLGNMDNVFAAKPSLIPVLNISGIVVEKGEMSNDEGFIKLKTGKGLVEVLVTAETGYDVPGEKEATFTDIKIGDRIKVVATRTNCSLIADNVTVLPQFAYSPYLVKKKVWIELPPQLIKLTLLSIPPQLVKVWIH